MDTTPAADRIFYTLAGARLSGRVVGRTPDGRLKVEPHNFVDAAGRATGRFIGGRVYIQPGDVEGSMSRGIH